MLTEKQLFCLLPTLLLLLLCALLEPTACNVHEVLPSRWEWSSILKQNVLGQAKRLKRQATPTKFLALEQHKPPQMLDVQRIQTRIKEIFDFNFENKNPTTAKTTTPTRNKDFIYPGAAALPAGIDSRLNLPEAPICEEDNGKTFCTKVKNYPKLENLENLLKNELDKFEPFFGEDLPQPQNVSQRINGQPEEESLCNSQASVIYPESGKTRDNVNRFIVNTPTYKQGVRIEECLQENEVCKYSDSFPNGYRTACKQNYIYRQLVVFAKDKLVVKEEIKLPSCCMCKVINLKG